MFDSNGNYFYVSTNTFPYTFGCFGPANYPSTGVSSSCSTNAPSSYTQGTLAVGGSTPSIFVYTSSNYPSSSSSSSSSNSKTIAIGVGVGVGVGVPVLIGLGVVIFFALKSATAAPAAAAAASKAAVV